MVSVILKLLEDMSYKGPIDKFIPDEYERVKSAELAGLTGRRYNFLHG